MPPELSNLTEDQVFHRRVLRLLQKHHLPFLVGGDYAYQPYTGVQRHPKDLDLFVRPVDCKEALRLLSDMGYRTELTASHWLGKAFFKTHYVDVIFGFSNGLGQVNAGWFRRAFDGTVLGTSVPLVSPEDMIWMKAFVQERDRYDGADVAHLLHACFGLLDWKLLLNQFGSYWRVLLSHLILYGFIYPGDRNQIPVWLMEELMRRLQRQLTDNGEESLCQGTLFSSTEYKTDLEKWNFRDARLIPVASDRHA